MSKIGTGRYSESLRRLLAVRASNESPINELAPELSAVMDVESDRPEWRFLKGERLIRDGYLIGKVAANMSQWQIRNPANSGMIAVLYLTVQTDSTSVVETRIVQTSADLANGRAKPIATDSRWFNNGAAAVISPLQPSDANTAVSLLGQVISSIIVAGNGPPIELFPRFPVILTPGYGIGIEVSTVNIDLRVQMEGYERAADRVELP